MHSCYLCVMVTHLGVTLLIRKRQTAPEGPLKRPEAITSHTNISRTPNNPRPASALPSDTRLLSLHVLDFSQPPLIEVLRSVLSCTFIKHSLWGQSLWRAGQQIRINKGGEQCWRHRSPSTDLLEIIRDYKHFFLCLSLSLSNPDASPPSLSALLSLFLINVPLTPCRKALRFSLSIRSSGHMQG